MPEVQRTKTKACLVAEAAGGKTSLFRRLGTMVLQREGIPSRREFIRENDARSVK